jgi:hypothetical protein
MTRMAMDSRRRCAAAKLRDASALWGNSAGRKLVKLSGIGCRCALYRAAGIFLGGWVAVSAGSPRHSPAGELRGVEAFAVVNGIRLSTAQPSAS